MSHITYVIPAFNTAGTLEASVDSIFRGNFSVGDDVIIVNDASTDTTLALATTLAQRYAPHITVITNATNKGCPASRNVGITAARGELIMNLDGDNILVPGSVAQLKNALIANSADIATFASYHYFNDNPARITHLWHCRTGIFTLADLFAGHINPGPGGNFLYTKASWERIGGYWEYGKGLHEAWGFTLKQLAAGAKVFVVPNTFYLHRHGHASLFATESKKKTEEYVLTRKMIEPYLTLLEPSDRAYVETNSNWQEHLGDRPIKLKGQPIGKNGTTQRTWFGLWLALRFRFLQY